MLVIFLSQEVQKHTRAHSAAAASRFRERSGLRNDEESGLDSRGGSYPMRLATVAEAHPPIGPLMHLPLNLQSCRVHGTSTAVSRKTLRTRALPGHQTPKHSVGLLSSADSAPTSLLTQGATTKGNAVRRSPSLACAVQLRFGLKETEKPGEKTCAWLCIEGETASSRPSCRSCEASNISHFPGG